MIDIHVGEYARTTQGYIAKVERIDDTFIWFDGVIWFDYEEWWALRIKSEFGLDDQSNEIIKHSFNILDLIEVKDILRIIMCDDENIDKENPYETLWYIDTSYTLNNIIALIKANEVSLLGVATHQQFENIEYKAGGEDDQQR